MCMDHRFDVHGSSAQVQPASLDARDLVSILTCFNVDGLPNSGDTQPVVAYEKKSNALVLFEKKPASCAMSRANVQNTGLCTAIDG